MILSAAETEIERLSSLYPKGYDLSLDRIARLLDRLGNPHRNLPPVLHIAGTNGKGSAAAFSRALLEESGYRVHVHTSPHLVNWHERFRLAGKLVDDTLLARTIRRVAEANQGETITIFEILTGVMFVLFAEHPADAAIVEVGLGGRFDATNIIDRPAATLIMPISLDHQSHLGDRIEMIAAEKAGIIKKGIPVVIGAQESGHAREVLVDTAERLGCPTWIYGQDFLAYEENGQLIYQDEQGLMDLSLPRLAGRHQLANAAAAITAVRAAGFAVEAPAANRAMSSVVWPGRMQRLPHGRLSELGPEGTEIWIDGGHNPGAGAVIAETLAALEEKNPRPLFLITGMINTKDPTGYFRAFEDMARHVFAVPVKGTDAGIAPEELMARADEAGLSAEPINSVDNALKLLRDTWDDSEPAPRILIGGSLYLVGDVLFENGTPPS